MLAGLASFPLNGGRSNPEEALMWGQPPSAVRRAKLDDFSVPHGKLAHYAVPRPIDPCPPNML